MRRLGKTLLLFGCSLLVAILTCLPLSSHGQSSPQLQEMANVNGNRVVRVGVYNAPPFAIKSGDDWDGIAVHLWREIARNLDLDYQWQELEPNQAIESVATGEVDLGIIAVATATNEQKVDLTHPYYNSTIGIAEQRQRNIWQVTQAVISPTFLRVLVGLSIVFVIIGVLVWGAERHQNDQFEKSPAKGIWTGFWWAGVTMTTIGYGDKTPKTVLGRIIALIWMLIAMGITASLTATITSTLTSGSLLQGVQVPQTLSQTQVGSISGSKSAQYLQHEEIQFQTFSKPIQGLRAIRENSIDLFVYEAATLNYLNRNSFNKLLNVQDTEIPAADYAFALPQGDTGFEMINQQLLQATGEPDWQALLNRYLPEND